LKEKHEKSYKSVENMSQAEAFKIFDSHSMNFEICEYDLNYLTRNLTPENIHTITKQEAHFLNT